METKKRAGRSKRLETIRVERRRQRRRQQLATVLIIGGIVIAVVAVIVIINLKNTLAPAGNITAITPVPRYMANSNSEGNPNAAVKIIEFSDFQCPYCLKFYKDVEPSIETDYVSTGKVFFTYRSMGQWIGSESAAAAAAVYCAADQNKFWEYHDILFANQTGENIGDFTKKRLIAFGQSVGLDMNAFQSCINKNTYSSKVTQDYNDGIKAGVQGTPTIIINGKIYTGDMSYSAIKQAIDTALAGK